MVAITCGGVAYFGGINLCGGYLKLAKQWQICGAHAMLSGSMAD